MAAILERVVSSRSLSKMNNYATGTSESNSSLNAETDMMTEEVVVPALLQVLTEANLRKHSPSSSEPFDAGPLDWTESPGRTTKRRCSTTFEHVGLRGSAANLTQRPPPPGVPTPRTGLKPPTTPWLRAPSSIRPLTRMVDAAAPLSLQKPTCLEERGKDCHWKYQDHRHKMHMDWLNS